MEAGDGEVVSYLTYPFVKRFLSSHATQEKQSEVQNAITWSLSTHKEQMFTFFVCSDEATLNVVFAGQTSV